MTETAIQPKRLFVWSGGGMTGLDIHAGLAMALAECGIEPDANSGTSAGAVFAAWHALGLPASKLAEIIAGLRDRDVRRERLAWKLRIPWINSFLENEPILKLLQTWLPGGFNDLQTPLSTWAVNALSGALTNVARPELAPSLAEACLASMAIAGVFPRVRLLDGNEYIDGGSKAYLPLPEDFAFYDEVYLLVAQTRPEDYRKKHGMLTALMSNASWAMEGQVRRAIARATAHPCPSKRVILLWPNIVSRTGSLRFDHSLIDQAYVYALEALGSPGVRA